MFKKLVNSFYGDNFYIELSLNKIFIHNYLSIVSTSVDRVVIKCSELVIVINGSDLIISKLDKFDVLINGNITGVIYEK